MLPTMSDLAREAVMIQDASNGLGLSKGYAEALQHLSDRLKADGLPNDTNAIQRHPVNRLWVSKLHDLASMGLSDFERYETALKECNRLAGL